MELVINEEIFKFGLNDFVKNVKMYLKNWNFCFGIVY